MYITTTQPTMNEPSVEFRLMDSTTSTSQHATTTVEQSTSSSPVWSSTEAAATSSSSSSALELAWGNWSASANDTGGPTGTPDPVILLLSQISEFVMNVFAPVACAVGITGCAMGLILLSSTNPLKRLASCHYLYALAVSSIVYLSCLCMFWIEAVFNLPTYSYAQISCKTFIYLMHVADFVTAWLIVLIAADRVLTIHQPSAWQRVRNNVDLTTKRAFINRVIAAVVLVAMSFESWIFIVAYLHKPTDPNDSAMCTIHPDHEDTYALLIRVECVTVLLLPTIITTVLTGVAIYGYRKLCLDVAVTVRFRTNASVIIEDDQLGTTEHQVTYTFNTTRCSFQTTDLTSSSPISSRNEMFARRLKTAERQVTKTLLMLTTMFVLLNLPHNSIRLWRTFISTSFSEVEKQVWFITLDVLAWLLYYFYYATLFYFYIFWSPKMRSRLVPTAWKLLECYCMNPQSHLID